MGRGRGDDLAAAFGTGGRDEGEVDPEDFERPRGPLDFDEAVGLSEVEFGDGGDEAPAVALLNDEVASVLDGGGGVAPDLPLHP